MQINEYFVPVIHTFKFLDTENEAKTGTKAVLGTIISSLSDELAQDFAASIISQGLRNAFTDSLTATSHDCMSVFQLQIHDFLDLSDFGDYQLKKMN